MAKFVCFSIPARLISAPNREGIFPGLARLTTLINSGHVKIEQRVGKVYLETYWIYV